MCIERVFKLIGNFRAFCALLFSLLLSLKASAVCPFDVAGSARPTLTSDGLLLLRYPNASTVDIANGSFAANSGSVSGIAVANSISQRTGELDINRNGRFDADDAQIIARYLAGFRGEALRTSAPDASRVKGYEIETFIANGCGRTACDDATGRVLNVGAGKTYATPSAAAVVARDGDIVKIAAGDYSGDYATWTANNLTICGEGGRARLFANSAIPNGKAIWVIRGNDATVDTIEFHNAKVPDQNGAGIRTEGINLTVINSGFYDNENGILGGLSTASTLTINRSEFARNGFGDGFSHNLYINNIGRLNVKASFFHEAKVGHNLKSRARVNAIENSYFMDGPSGNSSYLADFSNGGDVYLRGNLFHKGPNAENTSAAIAYGQEGLSNPVNKLTMIHNTIVMQRASGNFGGYVVTPNNTQTIRLTANLLASTGNPALIVGGFNPSNAIQQSNFTTSASSVPGADDIAAPNFWLNAALLPQIELATPIDATYSRDAAQPYQMRTLIAPKRFIGALQASP
jgi:hypothetical protein